MEKVKRPRSYIFNVNMTWVGSTMKLIIWQMVVKEGKRDTK